MFYKWLEINWDMTFRIYPDVIVAESLPNYASSHAVACIREELAKSEPDTDRLFNLISGNKYNQPIV